MNGLPQEKSDVSDPISQNCVLSTGPALSLLQSLDDECVQLLISSPPYCIGQKYEKGVDLGFFQHLLDEILPDCVRVLKPGGSMAWQVGYQARDNVLFPLDYSVYTAVSQYPQMLLRNRLIWEFGHGHHLKKRFSGRHETILWFTKGNDYVFNLDAVRVPQKYPGKKHYKGSKKGEHSGNPKGKNPSDVWQIPNVKASHVEKTEHPCQFPVGLADRLVRALSSPGDLVLDPFMGSGTSGVAAILNGRQFAGADTHDPYVQIARKRIAELKAGTLRYRDPDLPVREPNPKEKVSKAPPHFLATRAIAP